MSAIRRVSSTFNVTPTARSTGRARNHQHQHAPPLSAQLYGGIYESETAANANYNSLQVSFTRRFAHNFSLNANYVWSKAMDIRMTRPPVSRAITVSNSNDFSLDRGPAGFNYPHVFKMSWVYKSPDVRIGSVGPGVRAGRLAFEWHHVARSGNSLNVLSGTDTNLDGVATDRPNVVGDPTFMAAARARNKSSNFSIPRLSPNRRLACFTGMPAATYFRVLTLSTGMPRR